MHRSTVLLAFGIAAALGSAHADTQPGGTAPEPAATATPAFPAPAFPASTVLLTRPAAGVVITLCGRSVSPSSSPPSPGARPCASADRVTYQVLVDDAGTPTVRTVVEFWPPVLGSAPSGRSSPPLASLDQTWDW